MATANTLRAPALKEVLAFYLDFWQGAVLSIPIPPVQELVILDPRETPPRYLIEYRSYERERAANSLPLHIQEFRMPYLMKNRCDDFALVLELPLGQTLRQLFGPNYNVTWIRFNTEPKFLLAYSPEPIDSSLHSALMVTESNGQRHIFDGTIEQFGIFDQWLSPFQGLLQDHEAEGEQGA